MKYTYMILLILGTFTAHTQVKDFTLENVQDRNNVSLSQFGDKKGVAIIFTSNICPYAVYYEGRLTQLVADY